MLAGSERTIFTLAFVFPPRLGSVTRAVERFICRALVPPGHAHPHLSPLPSPSLQVAYKSIARMFYLERPAASTGDKTTRCVRSRVRVLAHGQRADAVRRCACQRMCLCASERLHGTCVYRVHCGVVCALCSIVPSVATRCAVCSQCSLYAVPTAPTAPALRAPAHNCAPSPRTIVPSHNHHPSHHHHLTPPPP